jgi:predicted flap endonuclease-1-like 5' DNA nuclease
MNDCGVMYMAWGENAIAQAKQSIYSLKRFLPKMPVMVVGDLATVEAFAEDGSVEVYPCSVDPFDEDQKKGFKFLAGRIKPLLDAISPWERTLYVDADTYFQRPPTEGFGLLDRWDVALAETQTRTLAEGIAGKEECEATAEEFGSGLLLYHNSGMIFWKKNKRTRELFIEWQTQWHRYQGWDEQVALLRALLRTQVLFLTLPYTWNHPEARDCYMLSHWYGAGDARFDMKQRIRQVELHQVERPSRLVKLSLGTGQWVQCREDDVDDVRDQFGIEVQRPLALGKEIMMRKDNPLVKVYTAPGQYSKMRLKDAEKLGLEYEYEKGRAPEGNKMMAPDENKAAKNNSEIASSDLRPPRNDKEDHHQDLADFTEISGVGKATAAALHENGIDSFVQLRQADVSFLPGKAQSVIEEWRKAE